MAVIRLISWVLLVKKALVLFICEKSHWLGLGPFPIIFVGVVGRGLADLAKEPSQIAVNIVLSSLNFALRANSATFVWAQWHCM